MRKTVWIAAPAAVMSFMLGGCAMTPPLPEPLAPESGMAVLSLDITLQTLLGPRSVHAAEVTLARLKEDGTIDSEVRSTTRRDNYAIFPNLAPAKYKLLRALYVQTSTSAGPSSSSRSGNLTFTTSSSFTFTNSAVIPFDPAVAERSLVAVPPGAVVYMGDFTAEVTIRMGFPRATYDPTASGGDRTDAGRKQAYEMLKTDFSASPWAKRPMQD